MRANERAQRRQARKTKAGTLGTPRMTSNTFAQTQHRKRIEKEITAFFEDTSGRKKSNSFPGASLKTSLHVPVPG